MGRHSDDESGTGRLPAARAGRRHDGLSGSGRGVSGPGDDGVGHDGFGFGANRDPRRRRRTWGVLAVVLVAMLVGALLVWRSAADSCGDGTVTVAADPAIAEAMTEIAKKAGDDSCYTFAVESVSGKDIPARLTGGDKSPDLWVADSSYQTSRVGTQVRRTLAVVSPSVVATPAVIVGRTVEDYDSWVDVITLPDLRMSSPVDSATGNAPIIGAVAGAQKGKIAPEKLTEAMSAMALAQNNVRKSDETDQQRLALANTSNVLAVTTEQQYLKFLRGNSGSQLTAKTPADGTVMLEYPVVNSAGQTRRGDAEQAGKVLAEAVASEQGRDVLDGAGFRAPDGSGIGDKVAQLKITDPKGVDKALRQWQVLATPMRSLVVLDGSGSMQATIGDSTRANVLIDAALEGLRLFPNNAELGTWLFGIDKGGPGVDWDELAPIKRLDTPGHREKLVATATDALTNRLGGGTGLYDTALAAYIKVQDSYDPSYSNSVILMTDGRNEDENSISLEQLLARLTKRQDPARPVLLVTIGISEDADTSALKQIADATGATTHIERSAADVKGVFYEAIAARIAAVAR
ncbi:substrate-binding domain-containing protein [Gordonia sp. (in: high G+C Gram-positive bacteria)]|uniref:substrate-binding domain-containing protein n=2 Tax=Gordonia sp. (in: high G+C Gram-positive bacteria) TaxID=84139 RepID=UPI002FDA3EA1